MKIHKTAYVQEGTVIGRGVEIAEMACIGSRGMTLKRDPFGKISWRRKGKGYPVTLKNGSYVGARSIIMRGTKWHTTIGENTFIGPNVSVGHDVIIGSSCMIMSGTIICGSTKIGEFSYIAPGCLIRDNITIGRDCFVGLGSLVVKDIPIKDKVFGRPAKSAKDD